MGATAQKGRGGGAKTGSALQIYKLQERRGDAMAGRAAAQGDHKGKAIAAGWSWREAGPEEQAACSGGGSAAAELMQAKATGWAVLPPELVAQVYAHLPLRDRKLGRRVCRGWQRGVDLMVTRLRVGPQTREPHAWNRQLLMMRRLPRLFPCLREIDFDQGVGSDLLVREPGLPSNLDIIPRVPRIGVTSSRTSLHLAAVRGLAARPEVSSFQLLLPSPVTPDDLAQLLAMLAPKLTALEVQQAHELSAACLSALAAATQLGSLSLEGIPRMGHEGWRALAGLRTLTRLAVRSRGDNAGLGQIAALTGLRDLRLKVREIDADGVLALQALTDLRALDLEVWVSPVRPRVIEAMLSFARLEAVRLEAYSSLETARCFAALRHLPRLAHLDLRLSGSVFALEDNLEALGCLAQCSRLESLCIAAPAPTLAALAACSGITALRLSDASMLSNRITGEELPKLPRLRHLNLMHCCAVTDGGLGAAAALYPHLTSLQLKSEALTDAGLARLAGLHALERLELVDCEGVQGRCLPALLPGLPRLLVITIIGNDSALAQARRAAREARPDMEVAKGRYPFELDNSLRPLQDRIYF